jgi:hypothetical protein
MSLARLHDNCSNSQNNADAFQYLAEPIRKKMIIPPVFTLILAALAK